MSKHKKHRIELKNIFGVFSKTFGLRMSMRARLYGFLFMFVMVMVIGFVVVLNVTGQFPAGMKKAEEFAREEFSAVAASVSGKCGYMEIQLVNLSQALSQSVEYQLSQRQIHITELKEHPEVLTDIIENELSLLQLALERTGCSGVFLVLDATVNPALANAEYSKTGLYMRYSEPRIPGSAYMTWDILRGNPHIAYRNNLITPRNWEMEFDVKDRAFFQLPITERGCSGLPLSKRDYWSTESIINDSDDAMLTCCIPLLDADGEPFGVCGLEMSAWNFANAFAPDDSVYPGVICVFGAINEDGLNLENALYSGRRLGSVALRLNKTASIKADKALNRYDLNSGRSYLGLHEEIRLHATDSPYSEQRYAVSLLIPQTVIDETADSERLLLFSILAVLTLLGAVGSITIGRRYLTPIISALEVIRSGNLTGIQTNIVEIDNVIAQMRDMRSKDKPLTDDIFAGFKKRVNTLSAIEKTVFRCYLEGLSDRDILKKLYISKGDLTTHNGRIYEKLGIAGADALQLYIELIKMSGQQGNII